MVKIRSEKSDSRKTRQEIDTAAIVHQASGRWLDILATTGGIPAGALDGKHHPCPRCGGRDRFRLIDANAGAVLCNQCGRSNGDGIASIRWVTDMTFRETCEAICHHLGIDMPVIGGSDDGRTRGRRRGQPGAKPASTATNNNGKQLATDQLRFLPWSDYMVSLWARHKPPITPGGVALIGGQLARYLDRYTVVALPVWGERLTAADPVGWVLYNTTGKGLPVFEKGNKEPTDWVKVKTLPGTGRGWIGNVQHLGAATTVWKLEGPSDVLGLLSTPDRPTDGVAVLTNVHGCGENPGGAPWMLESVAGKRVNVCHDADRPGQDGAIGRDGRPGWAPAIATTAVECRHVQLPYPVSIDHGKDLRDWLREGHGYAEALELEFTIAAPPSAKPEIILGLDEARVARETLEALSELGWKPKQDADERVYQRHGKLVQVIRTPAINIRGIAVPSGTLRIRSIPNPIIRERISSACRMVVDSEEGLVEKHAPDYLTKAIAERGQYPESIRLLTGIVRSPTLRPDGTVLQDPGYDMATGLLYAPDGKYSRISERPTRADAIQAAKDLLHVVVDFPFVAESHRSVWLAAVETMVARSAIEGCTPAFVFDANVPGAGKSLLGDVASLISYGTKLARKTWMIDYNELRKTITATAIEGIHAVLFDNVAGVFGSPSLDAAITGTTWTDRVLCTNTTTGDLPLTCVWLATGNNIQLGHDIPRRILYPRIESPVECPEDRIEFEHANLPEWVADNRHLLAVAAVTILRAYVAAGKPNQLPPWGSFEAWSKLVRSAIVWAGCPDPCDTRALVREKDRSAELLRMFLDGIQEADVDGSGVSSADIKRLLERPVDEDNVDPYPTLRAAVGETCRKMDTRSIGYALRPYVGRICAGRRLVNGWGPHKIRVWQVQQVYPARVDGVDRVDVSKPRGEKSETEMQLMEKQIEGCQASTLSTPSTRCNHLDPAEWVHREGNAFCPGCDRYMGRAMAREF